MLRKFSHTVIAAWLAASPAHAADPLEEALKTTVEGHQETAQTQQQINTLSDQTRDLTEEYRQVLARTEDLHAYNDQIEKLVASQKTELDSLARQIGSVQITQQKIVPLLLRMVEVLENMIKLDVPFLAQERAARLESLKQMMDRADVSLPEKYRRVMEAYQVEAEYGRTIEAYTEPLNQGGSTRTVNFLRVGRVALLYAGLDGGEAGYWDRITRSFQPLPKDYVQDIERGLSIARKESPPDLIKVPLPPPETAK